MINLGRTNLLKIVQQFKLQSKNSFQIISLNNQPNTHFHKKNIQLEQQIRYSNVKLATNQLMTKNQEQAEIMKSKKKKDKDRFDELFELSRNRRLHLTLNDYVSIFLRVTELRLDTTLKSLYGLSELHQKIEKEIQKADEEEPSIGRLSLCLSRSKICEVFQQL